MCLGFECLVFLNSFLELLFGEHRHGLQVYKGLPQGSLGGGDRERVGLTQCCGFKYIEFGSGSIILAQFGSRSRVMLSIMKKIIKTNFREDHFSLKSIFF